MAKVCGVPIARSSLLRLTLAIVLLGVVLVAGAPPAEAQGPGLAVEAGFMGRHRPGTDLLLQIEIDADRLIDGELVISSEFGERTDAVEVNVEVAGGARKLFLAVVPGVSSNGPALRVDLVEGGSVTASERVNVNGIGQGELVGLLPSLVENMPATAALAVPLGDATLAPVTEQILGAGPGAIDALSMIVGSSEDLRGISADAQTTLQIWVRAGGDLVIDDAPGPVPGAMADSSQPVA